MMVLKTMDNRKDHSRFILWVMGPTSSGKTTLSHHIVEYLRMNGKSAVQYDGDEVRKFFGTDHSFSKSDRLKVVQTLVYLANKSLDAGLNVVVSALTANEDARNYVRKNTKNLIVVYLKCSIEKCIARDSKGLYKKAIEGEIKTLIGFNSKYIPMKDPDIVLNTETKTPACCVSELMKRLIELGIRM